MCVCVWIYSDIYKGFKGWENKNKITQKIVFYGAGDEDWR